MIKINKDIRDAIKKDSRIGKIIKNYNRFIEKHNHTPNYAICKLIDAYTRLRFIGGLSFVEDKVNQKAIFQYVTEDYFVNILISFDNESFYILDVVDFTMEI